MTGAVPVIEVKAVCRAGCRQSGDARAAVPGGLLPGGTLVEEPLDEVAIDGSGSQKLSYFMVKPGVRHRAQRPGVPTLARQVYLCSWQHEYLRKCAVQCGCHASFGRIRHSRRPRSASGRQKAAFRGSFRPATRPPGRPPGGRANVACTPGSTLKVQEFLPATFHSLRGRVK